MGRHVKSLEFFDVLLGDRPPLSAVDTFYQRILADNPNEALANAERLLAERSLLDYYDTVVLPALKLAAADQASGKLRRERALEMSRSMLAVIEELCEHVDVAPGGAPAALRDPADRALRRRRVRGRAWAVRRRRGGDARPVAAAARRVDAHRPARGRVARRHRQPGPDRRVGLRRVLPGAGRDADAPALARRAGCGPGCRRPASSSACGPKATSMLSDATIQRQLGADGYVGSLRAAVDATLADGAAAAPIDPKPLSV